MIAHQWRQPLTSLMALLSKMKLKQEMGVMSKEDFLNDFTKGKNIVAHLSKTVDLFRDYFKEKQGAPTDISSLLKNVNEILLALMDSNNIATKFECKDGPLQIDDRLDQVILNIYQNASDALMQKNIEMKYIHTKAYPQGNMAVVEIQDNAGGIPEEIIQKIFTPYFSTKSKNGSGLGLYMSKDIVENTLKGKLSVKNTKDGACFTIKVPIIKLTKQGEK
jgi:signal transduction histidine kinase